MSTWNGGWNGEGKQSTIGNGFLRALGKVEDVRHASKCTQIMRILLTASQNCWHQRHLQVGERWGYRCRRLREGREESFGGRGLVLLVRSRRCSSRSLSTVSLFVVANQFVRSQKDESAWRLLVDIVL